MVQKAGEGDRGVSYTGKKCDRGQVLVPVRGGGKCLRQGMWRRRQGGEERVVLEAKASFSNRTAAFIFCVKPTHNNTSTPPVSYKFIAIISFSDHFHHS